MHRTIFLESTTVHVDWHVACCMLHVAFAFTSWGQDWQGGGCVGACGWFEVEIDSCITLLLLHALMLSKY